MTCVLQKKPTQGWFGRPHPEGRTHMCPAKYKSFEGCTPGQGLQLQGFGRPRNTHVCPRKNKLRVARKDLGLKKYKGLAPTSCCCEHTHMCFRISKLRLHPKIRGLQGLGRPGAAASRHMCVSEKTPFIQGCTQGSKVVWGRLTNCCCKAVSIHMCVAESLSTQGLHQGSKRYNSLADQLLRPAYTYVCQKQFQVAPKDHRLHGTGRPTARICQVKVAPKGQGLQVFGRLRVAVSVHVCVAK